MPPSLLLLACLSGLAPTLAETSQDPDPAALLRSKDPVERLRAVELLRGGENPKAERLLKGALDDADWEVIERAAEALGEVGGPKAVGELVAVLLDGPARRVRRAAALAAAALDPDEALADVAKKIGGRKTAAALEAFPVLAAAASEPSPPRRLVKLLGDRDGRTRAAAAGARLTAAREDRAEVLADLVGSEFIAVRAAALEGAASDPRPGQVDLLAELLSRPALPGVIERRALAALVAGLGTIVPEGARATEAVAHVARLCGSPEATVAARGPRLARALLRAGLIEVDGLRDALEPALEHDAAGVRAEGTAVLGEVGEPWASERARVLGEGDASPRVRHAAFSVLGAPTLSAEDFDAAWFVARLRDETDPGVRERAAVALGRDGLAEAVAPLAEALGSPDWKVAAAAAVSLGHTRSEAAVDPLVRLARSDSWRLRGAAVVGLTRCLKKAAVEPLIAALEDREPLVARTAHAYLVSLAREELEPRTAVWAAWWAEHGDGVRLVDPREVADRERRYGYSVPAALIYEGLDVMVLESRGDHIQHLLEALEIEHRLCAAARIEVDALDAAGVFVANCTGEVEDEAVERLEWFVHVGGYLFASCWALHETIERIEPGLVRKLETGGEVLDNVLASPCATDSPYLEGVFTAGVRPIYALQGAHLIEVLHPERVEVLVDSPECAERWGGGELACWFRLGHGVVLDSVNHFDLQGLELASHLKKREERMAYAMDHMGLSHERLRATRKEKWWDNNLKAAREVRDLSVFRLVTNFVRLRRIQGR
ncbi:MAG: HEAT repeat domain-containing protein [Planctomycetota bacterium]|nr:HEAT repeat domain-containing protein [Planctomycetota bacterium]